MDIPSYVFPKMNTDYHKELILPLVKNILPSNIKPSYNNIEIQIE